MQAHITVIARTFLVCDNHGNASQWDHVDHQFNFIQHWTVWYFDFDTHASAAAPAPPPARQDAAAAQPEEQPANQASPEVTTWHKLFPCQGALCETSVRA
jgi:hypothetical protein